MSVSLDIGSAGLLCAEITSREHRAYRPSGLRKTHGVFPTAIDVLQIREHRDYRPSGLRKTHGVFPTAIDVLQICGHRDYRPSGLRKTHGVFPTAIYVLQIHDKKESCTHAWWMQLLYFMIKSGERAGFTS